MKASTYFTVKVNLCDFLHWSWRWYIFNASLVFVHDCLQLLIWHSYLLYMQRWITLNLPIILSYCPDLNLEIFWRCLAEPWCFRNWLVWKQSIELKTYRNLIYARTSELLLNSKITTQVRPARQLNCLSLFNDFLLRLREYLSNRSVTS